MISFDISADPPFRRRKQSTNIIGQNIANGKQPNYIVRSWSWLKKFSRSLRASRPLAPGSLTLFQEFSSCDCVPPSGGYR